MWFSAASYIPLSRLSFHENQYSGCNMSSDIHNEAEQLGQMKNIMRTDLWEGFVSARQIHWSVNNKSLTRWRRGSQSNTYIFGKHDTCRNVDNSLLGVATCTHTSLFWHLTAPWSWLLPPPPRSILSLRRCRSPPWSRLPRHLPLWWTWSLKLNPCTGSPSSTLGRKDSTSFQDVLVSVRNNSNCSTGLLVKGSGWMIGGHPLPLGAKLAFIFL